MSSVRLCKGARIGVGKRWDEVLTGTALSRLEEDILPEYLRHCRWFAGKSRIIRSARFSDIFSFGNEAIQSAVVHVQYVSGAPENYFLPLSFVVLKEGHPLVNDSPQSVICHLQVGEDEGFLIDAVYDTRLHARMFLLMVQQCLMRNECVDLQGYAGRILKDYVFDAGKPPLSRVLKVDQSNTSIVFGEQFFLKVFRRLEEGINPDFEMGRYLSEDRHYMNTPVFAGQIQCLRPKTEPVALCVMQSFVYSISDAWKYTCDHLCGYYDHVLVKIEDKDPQSYVSAMDMDQIIDSIYIKMIKCLAQRTAEMHLALSAETNKADFMPESFSVLDQRLIYQNLSRQARLTMRTLRKHCSHLPEKIQGEAVRVLDRERDIYDRFKAVLESDLTGKKFRIHGDYHLGQVLFTGNDFVIIDFEGQPMRSLSERRLKGSALRDVAGMLRSFHYASYATFIPNNTLSKADITILQAAADRWYAHIKSVYLTAYCEAVGQANFLPSNRREFYLLLRLFLLDKAIYELSYELNNRPDWVLIPLKGICHILEDKSLT